MGPLAGLRIIEMGGIGPGQLCGMLLAEMGAELIRIERPQAGDPAPGLLPRYNLMNRSRPSIVVDVKRVEGAALVLSLCERADGLFEGYRPGVMERLGLGPDECLARNPRLVYGRVTGFGQDGPLAGAAGHDPNYVALTGALAAIGPRGGDPVLPLNLVADFGGGALYLALGMLAALLECSRSGRGQVVDAAMVDGVASMMTMFHGLAAAGLWRERRGSNLLDGGAPFFRAYATRDGGHVVIAPLEPAFWRTLADLLQLDPAEAAAYADPRAWPQLEARLEALFRTRTRQAWCELLEGSDACFAPVLGLSEAPSHPHNVARGTYVEVEGITQPAPAPRFSRTPGAIRSPPPAAPGDPGAVLDRWGVSAAEIAALTAAGVLAIRGN
jgi:alpha-methylacyl-CoA racemase